MYGSYELIKETPLMLGIRIGYVHWRMIMKATFLILTENVSLRALNKAITIRCNIRFTC